MKLDHGYGATWRETMRGIGSDGTRDFEPELQREPLWVDPTTPPFPRPARIRGRS